VQINCSTECVFNDHDIVMCRNFLKEEQKTCEISNNTDKNIVYDTANYRLIMVINYSDWMYQGRFRTDMDINDKIKLGDRFEQLDSGYPVFISDGNIEIAYHPDMTNVNNIQTFSKMVVDQIMDKIPKPAAV
ncbi:14829_t:CDS:1, partial [Racocetra persica]